MENKKDCCTCEKEEKKSLLHYRIGALVLGVLLAMLLIGNDASILLGSTEISDNLGIIFLLGLVASVSTCLAITGGVIVAYSDIIIDKNTKRGELLSHQLLLHGGRLIGFICFGAILGMLGQEISYSLGFTARINGIVAIILLLLGLHILGFVPKRTIGGIWRQHMHKKIKSLGNTGQITFLFGASTFFIPCGFTQMVQVMALSSGSLSSGALIMGIFALGTLPGLLLLGIGASLAKSSSKKFFERIIAILLIAFACYSLQGTFSLLGGITGSISGGAKNIHQEIVREYITITHNGLHIEPKDVVLSSGKNYHITIQPTSDGIGCMSSIALPNLDQQVYPIYKGKDIVYTIENAQKGQYTFVCSSMGMEQGTIIVE